MKLNFKHFIYIPLIALLAFSCIPKLKVKRVHFDENAGFYVYKHRNSIVALRFPNDQLVFRDSMNLFLVTVANNNMRYNADYKSENTLFFFKEEKSMLDLYNAIQASVENKSVLQGLTLVNEFENLYPAAFKYTDLDFLRAQLWEQLNNKDSAQFYYKRFLQFSEKKYSGFFRGYENDEISRDCYIGERKYAQRYLSGSEQKGIPVKCTADITPKYYFQSFSQGFVLNRDDFGPLKKSNFGLGLEYNDEQKLSVGLSNTWLTNENYTFKTSFSYSKNLFHILLSGSYQLYKAKDNSFGVKLIPSINFIQFNNQDSILSGKNYINPGLGVSIGYRFNQRWYIGASYSSYLFNQYTYKDLKKDYYLENNYDISIYYQLMKGISFKAGIESGYPVIGFGFIGSNLAYFFKNKGFGVRIADY